MSTASQIRDRVLRALALNRTPGYHYAGNFLEFSFDHVSEQDVRMSMAVGPHVTALNGNVDYGVLAVFADIAMAANVRAGHTPATRLATVQMNLQFTGAPITGALRAESTIQDYVEHIASLQAATRVTVTSNGKPVCYGVGTFMVLDKAKSKIIHHGRLTAVVRTEITGKGKRRVMEMITTHAHKAVKPHSAG